MKNSLVKTSKFLSLVLRHRPEKIGITIDNSGWVDVSELISCARKKGVDLSEDLIAEVVFKNDKQRFKLSNDGRFIRANQGHSIDIDLGLEPVQPPEYLFHGTTDRFLESIFAQGLLKRNRQYVHLSSDKKTAVKVGIRHGKPAILLIKAGKMYEAGYKFFISENKVWLTKFVPPEYIETIE